MNDQTVNNVKPTEHDKNPELNATESTEQAKEPPTSIADGNENPVYTENNPDESRDSIPGMVRDNTENHVPTENIRDTTDWEKLMINSDDSLFEEMTKQMDNKQYSTSAITTPIASPELEKEQIESNGKLPDLVQSNKDAVTALLMLSASVNLSMDNAVDMAIDADVNNEEILLVNALKMPDFTKDMAEAEKHNKDNPNNKTGTNSADNKPAPKTTSGKHKQILPEAESSSTDTLKSPSGRLIITRHRLKKTPVETVS